MGLGRHCRWQVGKGGCNLWLKLLVKGHVFNGRQLLLCTALHSLVGAGCGGVHVCCWQEVGWSEGHT